MRLLVTASNEHRRKTVVWKPYMTMLMRIWMDSHSGLKKQNFRAMLINRQDPQHDPVAADLKIHDDEYMEWQRALSRLS